MRAALYLGPQNIQVTEVETPRPADGEVLVKVGACAICGTDLRIYKHGDARIKPPHIVGHEICGIVEKVGAGVTTVREGQKVVIVTPVGCGVCSFCRVGRHNLCVDFKAIGYHFPGGFAEHILIGARAVAQGNLLEAPASLSFEEGALVEPLSCCINGQEYLDIGFGDKVVIVGAGPIGAMHTELARRRGAETIILVEVAEERLKLARERFHADHYINGSLVKPVEAVKELTGGQGADVVIIACSAPPAVAQGLEMARKRARVSLFAGMPKDASEIKLNYNLIHYGELSVYGAFASSSTQYLQALSLIATGTIEAKRFITGVRPLGEIVAAIQEAGSMQGLKVIVKP